MWKYSSVKNETTEKKRSELLSRLSPAQRLRRFRSWYKKNNPKTRKTLFWPSGRLGTLAKPGTQEYKRLKAGNVDTQHIDSVYKEAR
jgi:hypothetical protein